MVADSDNDECLDCSVDDPSPEDLGAEAGVPYPDIIESRFVEELLFLVLEIEKGEPHNWESCANDVVHLVEQGLIEGLA